MRISYWSSDVCSSDLRAGEFVDVVKDLWDSWADDAFTLDKDSGTFLDGQKVRLLNHEGKNFSIRGPLNSARPPQGHPIVVVAGASDSAMELAARTDRKSTRLNSSH